MTKNLIFFAILVLLLGFNGCIPDGGTITTTPDDPNNEKPGEEGNFAGLSAKTERQMKLDYVQTYLAPASTTADDIQIYYYFGNYNGYEVAAFLTGAKVVHSKHDLNLDLHAALTGTSRYNILFNYVLYNNNYEGKFEGLRGFQFARVVAMLAWQPDENSENGHFYAMQEAYNLSLLTRNDMQSMQNLYYDMGPFEDLDEEEKVRIAAWFWDNTEWRIYYYAEESFEDLDEERKNQMVFNFWNPPYGCFYLGTYHDYVILSRRGGWDISSRIYVYNFEFSFPSDAIMYAWYKGNGYPYFMEWSSPVEDYREIDYKDFLTEEDAKSMLERHIFRGK